MFISRKQGDIIFASSYNETSTTADNNKDNNTKAVNVDGYQ